jgi:hypothetical protein
MGIKESNMFNKGRCGYVKAAPYKHGASRYVLSLFHHSCHNSFFYKCRVAQNGGL